MHKELEFDDESDIKTMKVELDMETEMEKCRTKWKELEEKVETFLLDFRKGISDFESLVGKFTSLEKEKIGIEKDVEILKRANAELEKGAKGVVDLTGDEEDEVTKLIIENKVLECEKKTAENMVEDLKSKCRRLEMENLALKDKNCTSGLDVKTSTDHLQHEMAIPMGIEDLQQAGTPLHSMASDQNSHREKTISPFKAAMCYNRRVRKQMTFIEEASPSKMTPSTPGIKGPCPYGVVDISDSEDDQEHKKNVHTPHFGSLRNDMGDEDGTCHTFGSTNKRKRASNIIASDSESDDHDDDIPICKLWKKHLRRESVDDLEDFDLNDVVKESSSPRRRLLRICDRKVPSQNSPDCSHKKYRNEGVVDDEDETGSSTESETLGGFILSGSDISQSDEGSSVSKDVSDDNVDYGEVISKVRRKRNRKVKWEFEADMLSDFGNDVGLCMKAVCALYRQQTSEEKCSKATIFLNQRGFSQCDAPRGTALGEFLCDGDPSGDVCKSVVELREYNSKGPELCRTLATRYSKQLFAIYKNKEDPLFLPS